MRFILRVLTAVALLGVASGGAWADPESPCRTVADLKARADSSGAVVKEFDQAQSESIKLGVIRAAGAPLEGSPTFVAVYMPWRPGVRLVAYKDGCYVGFVDVSEADLAAWVVGQGAAR